MLYAEPTMYYDEGAAARSGMHAMKRNMTLDFAGGGSAAVVGGGGIGSGSIIGGGKQARFQNLLGSPDLHLLKLASPDIEKMLMQANCANAAAAAAAAAAIATPTPTQFIYPKYQATDEQEAYARGFVEALAELQHQEKYPGSAAASAGGHAAPAPPDMLSLGAGGAPPLSVAASTYSTLQPMPLSIMTSGASSSATSQPLLSCVGGGHPYGGGLAVGNGLVVGGGHHAHLGAAPAACGRRSMSVVSNSMSEPSSSGYSPSAQSVKEEPQTVPSSPLMSPVNMEVQEKIKLERKRARNRIAARKCRTRKLERIARLEEKVAELKGKNSELVAAAANLSEQVSSLQRQIGDHLKSGCQLHPVGAAMHGGRRL